MLKGILHDSTFNIFSLYYTASDGPRCQVRLKRLTPGRVRASQMKIPWNLVCAGQTYERVVLRSQSER